MMAYPGTTTAAANRNDNPVITVDPQRSLRGFAASVQIARQNAAPS
jgi:hypothetical protein